VPNAELSGIVTAIRAAAGGVNAPLTRWLWSAVEKPVGVQVLVRV